MRVLIVDDFDPIRQLVVATVASIGAEVVGEVDDGRAAIDAAIALVPDVVIIDWQLPGTDGVTATRAIKSHDPDIDIIGHSTTNSAELERQFRDAGASDFIPKHDHARLVAALRRRLHTNCSERRPG